MHLLRFHLLTCALTLALLLPAHAADQTITFRFAPPNNTTYTEEQTETREFNADGEKMVRTSTCRARVTIVKTKNGYRTTYALTSLESRIDGETLEDPSNQAFIDCPLIYVHDTKGKILSILGTDKLIARLREASPEHAERAESLFDAKTMLLESRDEWDASAGYLLTAPMKIGERRVRIDRDSLPFDAGTMAYYTVNTLDKMVNVGETPCAYLSYRYDTEISSLTDIFGAEVGSQLKRLGKLKHDAQDLTSIAVSGSGYYLVDPVTMICHKDKSTETVTLTAEDEEGEQHTLTVKTTSETTIEFGDSGVWR